MNERQRRILAELCPTARWGVDMAGLSSFRAGGEVEVLVETNDCAALPELLRFLAREGIGWQVLGGGSNILFAGGLHEGVFIRLRGGAEDIRAEGCLVRVQAGVSMTRLLGWCLKHELGGLEFMAGIPGTVGGAVAMNAGAFGGATGDRLHAVRCLNAQGEEMEIAAADLRFHYRRTVFPGPLAEKCLILGATFALTPRPADEMRAQMRGLLAQRKAKQPVGAACAGSFFKNPPGDYAGRLIEQAGLKGYCQGRAMVSPKHGNIIVNRGGASPEDILGLMRFIQQRVHEHCGVMLEPEVRLF